jgi:alpha-methylacyl-CoA racemase
MASGPLNGVRVLEFAGLGPAPFCGMLLADMGADVLRIDRPGATSLLGRCDVTARGRRSLALDLKKAEAVEAALRLCERADVLIEGFRPGVMERLGLGPDAALGRNARLVYGRMTGWGQDGPLAQAAGHDLNYLALSGALHAIGPREKPFPPLNLVADYGGGAMYLAFGVLAALFHARSTGEGQVVDAAMVDGVASLSAVFFGLKAAGLWDAARREANLLDGGAPWYDVYECADGGWIAIGSLEPQFYGELLDRLGIEDEQFRRQHDPAVWPALRERLERLFRTRTRDQWSELLEGTDVCFAPVLSFDEAPEHPHARARGTYVRRDGLTQPAPAPRFSATPGEIQGPPPEVGCGGREALRDWGFAPEDVEALVPAERP